MRSAAPTARCSPSARPSPSTRRWARSTSTPPAGEALEQRDRVMTTMEALLIPGFERKPDASPIAAEAIGGAIYSMIYDQVRRGGAESMQEIAPLATYVTLAPSSAPSRPASWPTATVGGARGLRAGMAGAPLRELMSHASFARLATNEERLRRALNHECSGRLRRHSRRGAPATPSRRQSSKGPACSAPLRLKLPSFGFATQLSKLAFLATARSFRLFGPVERGARSPSRRMSPKAAEMHSVLLGAASAALDDSSLSAAGACDSIRLEGDRAPPTGAAGIEASRGA